MVVVFCALLLLRAALSQPSAVAVKCEKAAYTHILFQNDEEKVKNSIVKILEIKKETKLKQTIQAYVLGTNRRSWMVNVRTWKSRVERQEI